jgi:hypothetical protein
MQTQTLEKTEDERRPANRPSNGNYNPQDAMLKLAKVIAGRANAISETRYEFRFCLPTGTRVYRDLKSGTLVLFSKSDGKWAPVSP